jgi:hypothetical protein
MNGRLASADKAQTAQQLRVQAIQLQNQFVMLLEGVEKERYEVWEVRDKWERFKEQVVELNETLGYWRESFSEVQALDLSALVPGLDVLTQEIDQRLTQLNRMLADDAPTQAAQPIELAPNPSALQALSAFQKAAFTVYFKHLRSLDTLTRTMFDTLGDIKGFAPESSPVAESQSTPFFALLDIDRLLGALRVVLTLWLSYALLIWFNPIPGGGNLVAMAAASGMAVALAPQLPIKMFMPALTAFILFTAVIYFFLLPQLTTFAELGLVIFVVSFLVFYRYFEPQQMLFKGLGIVLFLTLINVHNEQSYDFKYFADTSVMFYIIALVLQITAFIPFSPKPEHAYLRLVRRFFRCAEYLVSTLPKDPQEQLGPWENWKKAFCWREIAVVPNKLALWGQFINRQTRSGTSPEQIQALTINLHALTYRLQELLNARVDVHADRLVQEAQSQALRTSIRAWQTRMQETFQCLSADPTAGNSKTFRAELDEIVKNLETRIEETLNTSSKVQLDPEDRENVYRLLGAYRSVSEAMGDYVASTDAIHWSRWQEEKF